VYAVAIGYCAGSINRNDRMGWMGVFENVAEGRLVRGPWRSYPPSADLLTRLIPPLPLTLAIVTDPKQPIPAVNPYPTRTVFLSRFALQSYLAYVQSQCTDTDHVSSNRCMHQTLFSKLSHPRTRQRMYLIPRGVRIFNHGETWRFDP
jgi:hypothetical protein